VTGRPGGLGIGARVRFGGRDQVVIGVSGTSVRLADTVGEVVTVTVSGLLADGDFAVLDARPRPGLPRVSVLDDLPAGAAAEARWWERHIVEVLTGVPLCSGPTVQPRGRAGAWLRSSLRGSRGYRPRGMGRSAAGSGINQRHGRPAGGGGQTCGRSRAARVRACSSGLLRAAAGGQ
jgi:hypothetical protein